VTGLGGRLSGYFGRTKVQPEAMPTASAAAANFPGVEKLFEAASPGLSAGQAPFLCHRLTSDSGGFVSVSGSDAKTACLVTRTTLDAAFAVVAVTFPAHPGACILVAPGGSGFAVAGDTLGGIAVSARLLPTDTPGVVRLKHPLGSGRFLGCPEASPNLRFDYDGDGMRCAFTTTALPARDLPAGLRALVGEIGGAIADLRAVTLLACMANGALRPELAGALLRLLPQDELAELGRTLLHTPSARAQLSRVQLASAKLASDQPACDQPASAMPGEAWLRTALPALVAWEEGGRPPVPDHAAVSPASDEVALLPALGQGTWPIGLALHTLARRHVLPRRGACILATARNEGPYLLDWISYHLSVGFEHIFIYTNENSDGSDALLAALARHGVITLVQNERGASLGPQVKAYAHALTMLPQILDYRWTAIFDLDEYFAFNTAMFGGIGDYLAFHEAQPVDAIALCWAVFAGMPGDVWSEAPTLTRFTRRSRDINLHVKSVIRTRLFCYSQPHYPSATLDAPFAYRTESGRYHHHPGIEGRIAAFAEAPSANQAWVNHYLLRTAEEALWKWSRGRGDWQTSNIDALRGGFLDFVSKTFLDLARPECLVTDRRILDCARHQQPMLARLLALPGVADAAAAVTTQFAEQLSRNTDAFLAAPLPEDAAETLKYFRELIAATRL